jgi:hypothetical protein
MPVIACFTGTFWAILGIRPFSPIARFVTSFAPQIPITAPNNTPEQHLSVYTLTPAAA